MTSEANTIPFNLQYYSEAINVGHAEESYGAFQRTFSASGNPSEDGQPAGGMARQTISIHILL